MMMMMMIPTTSVSRTYSSLSFRFVVQMIALVIPLLLPSSSSSKTTTVQVTALFTTDEQTYLKIPNATLAKSSLHFLTRIPHVAGTEGDQLMAEFVHHEFMNAGIPIVDIDRLVAKLNYPNFESVHQPTASLSLWEITNTSDDEEEEDMIVEGEEDVELKTTTTVVGEKKVVRKRIHKHSTLLETRKLVYAATLSEDLLDDALDDTTNTLWRNHTFHGYSPSGTLHNKKFVYANYGRPQDFEVLEELGISVQGKIVVMRYGKCFRGLKVYQTQIRGGVGAILYSDPQDDGYTIGKVYPNGPWRSSSSVQRGSVQFISHCGGDPYRIDPRYQTLLNTTVEQLCGVNTSDIVPFIPSIPISYGDVIPLLQNLGGPLVDEIPSAIENQFAGGLTNISYRIGPSKGYLDLVVDNVNKIVHIPNVIGRIPGSLPASKDQPVLLGNHRDAWIYGAADPNSGTAALLEVAKGFGSLYRDHQWRPLRSIYFCSWSGEEYGLVGSTGWAELNMEPRTAATENNSVLKRSLVYLNTDTIVSGDRLKVSASPSLIPLWKSVLSDLENEPLPPSSWLISTSNSNIDVDRGSGISMNNSRFLANVTIHDANTDWEVRDNDHDDTSYYGTTSHYHANTNNVGVLGSGSDYTVFLDHFGIPSLDFSYHNKYAQYGQYHSVYDSFSWMDKYGGCSSKSDDDDETCDAFELMEFASKIWGLLAMRLATSSVVPIDHVSQGEALEGYTTYLQQELNSTSTTSTSTSTTSVIKNKHNTMILNLQGLINAVENYKKAAQQLQFRCLDFSQQKAATAVSSSSSFATDTDYNNTSLLSNEIDTCNEKLGFTERFFLLENGLPGRPWFKHCLQAPGLDLGYAAEAFPAIQQAIDESNKNKNKNKNKQANDKGIQTQIDVTAERIQAAATNLQL